ncbi:MAG: hypothetical protein ACE5H3_08415 [Planctomycetota bacterium]
MNPARLLLLAVLLLLAAAGIFFLAGRGGAPAALPAGAAAARPLLKGGPGELERVSIYTQVTERILAFEKEGPGNWRMTEPLRDRAEPFMLEQMERILFGGEWKPAPPEWRDRPDAELGLDPPFQGVEAQVSGRPVQILRIGATDFTGEWRAAEVAGRRIRLGPASSAFFQRAIDEWRDHRIFPDAGGARSVTWKPAPGGGPGFRLERKDGAWRVTDPEQAPLDPLAESGLRRMLGARASALSDMVVSKAFRERAAREGRLVVEGNGSSETVRLVGQTALVSGRDYPIGIDVQDFRLLRLGFDELRSRFVLSIPFEEVVFLRIRRKERSITFVRGASGWKDAKGRPLSEKNQVYVRTLVDFVCKMERGSPRPVPEQDPIGEIFLSRSLNGNPRRSATLRWWVVEDPSSPAPVQIAAVPGARKAAEVTGFNLDFGVEGLLKEL